MPQIATVISVQEDLNNGWHVTANVVAGNAKGFELLPNGIEAYVDASEVSDIDAETHSLGIRGPGKSPFKVGD
jgi:hypothetical protein